MSAPLPSQPKRLHEMNRLEDMGRFPVVVYLGATANVLVEMLFFYWLHGRVGGRFSCGLCRGGYSGGVQPPAGRVAALA